MRIGPPDLVAGECATALGLGYKAIKLHETTAPAVFAARKAIGAGYPADGRHELSAGRARKRSHSRMPAVTPRRCSSRSRSGRRKILRRWQKFAARRARRGRRRKCLHGLSVQTDDAGRRGQPRAAFGDQGRRHHRISEGRRTGRRIRRPADSAFALFRTGIAGDAAIALRCATTKASSRCST